MGLHAAFHLGLAEAMALGVVICLLYRYFCTEHLGSIDGGQLRVSSVRMVPQNITTFGITLSPDERWLALANEMRGGLVGVYDLVRGRFHSFACSQKIMWKSDRKMWTPDSAELYMEDSHHHPVFCISLAESPAFADINAKQISRDFLDSLTCSDSQVDVDIPSTSAASPRPTADIAGGAFRFRVERHGRFIDLIMHQLDRRMRLARHKPSLWGKRVEINRIYPAPTGRAVVYRVQRHAWWFWGENSEWFYVDIERGSRPIRLFNSTTPMESFAWSVDGKHAYGAVSMDLHHVSIEG